MCAARTHERAVKIAALAKRMLLHRHRQSGTPAKPGETRAIGEAPVRVNRIACSGSGTEY